MLNIEQTEESSQCGNGNDAKVNAAKPNSVKNISADAVASMPLRKEINARVRANLVASAASRQAGAVTSEFRKAGAITRSEADDKAINKSLARRARKTGQDVTVNTRISPDRDSAKTTYKFQAKGSSTKGGDAAMRGMAQGAKQAKAKATARANALATASKPAKLRTTARKRVSTARVRKMGVERNLNNIFG